MAENDELFETMRGHHEKAQAALDAASDMLDHIESRMPTIRGGNPLPQPRPRAAPGPRRTIAGAGSDN